MSRTITVTSGKGGVGKTNVSLNLAVYLSRKGHRTCLLDADLGLANVNILLGLQPEHDLKDVILNGLKLQDILIRTHEGVDVLPGSSGIEEVANLGVDGMENLLKAFSGMASYDFLLFDTSAGISKHVISFCLASSEVIIIVTPEPTSLIDAYALLKVLTLNNFKGEAKIVLNRCENAETAKLVYKKFKSAATKHLGVNTPVLGVIYQDEKVPEAVREQRPFLCLYPDAKASKCIEEIGERLLSAGPYPWEGVDAAGFFRKCLNLMKSPLNLPGTKKDSNRDRAESQPKKGEEKAEARGLKQSLTEAIEKLIGSIPSVSKELQMIREFLRENGRHPQHSENSGQSKPECQSQKQIRLNLEAFIKKGGLSGKES